MNDKGNLTAKRPPLIPMLFGTGFFSGLWPWGPGTAGSILATIIWVILGLLLPADGCTLHIVTLCLAIVFTPIGTWATKRLQPYWGDDPSRVVIDEMVGVWIPLIAVSQGEYWWALAALVLFRFFDIVKPLGIRSLDRRTGAFWVMGDDILGGIYALACIVMAKAIIYLI